MSDHVVSPKVYLLIFLLLLVATALTVWVAFLDLGFFNNVLALGIALFKATLVVLYFMHLRYSSHLSWVFAGAGFIWLVILLLLTLSDFLTRGWLGGISGWS